MQNITHVLTTEQTELRELPERQAAARRNIGIRVEDIQNTAQESLVDEQTGIAVIPVDDAIDSESINPVQNSVIASALSGIDTALGEKVDKVPGKGLSTEDYTTAEQTKLAGIETGAQENVIETVKVNNQALTPSGKAVNIDLSGYKTVQQAVSDPSADGTGLAFIDSVSQDASGVVTLHKKTVQDATTSVKGVVTLSNSYTSSAENVAATSKAVKDAYDDLYQRMKAHAVFYTPVEWETQSQVAGDSSKTYFVGPKTGVTPDSYDVYEWKDPTVQGESGEYILVDESSISLEGYWHGSPTATGDGNVVTGLTLGNDGVPNIVRDASLMAVPVPSTDSTVLGYSGGSVGWNLLEKSGFGPTVEDESGVEVTDESETPVVAANYEEMWSRYDGVDIGAKRAIADASGNVITDTYATKDAATTTSAGLMSAADKTKLDGITDYVVSASVSGGTLTLTPKNGEAVTFTGDTNVIEGVNVGNETLIPVNKVVTVPLFDGTNNGAVTAPTSANNNPASFLSGMGDWSMLEEVTDGDIDDIFVDGVTIGGRKYPYVQIGNQLWITRNLDYKFDVNGSQIPVGTEGIYTSTPLAWYYNNDEATYGIKGTYKCGLLYNWYAAKYLDDNKATLLPAGWKVPDTTDWNTLFTAIGGATGAGTKLKAPNGYITQDFPSNWNGTDDYGFHALPTGGGNGGGFGWFGYYGWLWTSQFTGQGGSAWRANIEFVADAGTQQVGAGDGYGIRLVKNLT